VVPEEHYLKQELYRLIQGDIAVFEFLQHGSLDGMWYWDLESPDHEWMSPGFWKTLGYDPDHMPHLASAWTDLIDPEDLAVARENFDRHCENPDHPYDQVVRYRHRDGSTVWVRCRGIAIRDDDGKPIRMLGAHTDLTLQKRAEERLQQSEAFLEAIFDAIQDGICVLDKDMKIVRLNQAMSNWYPRESDVVGRQCFSVFHGRTEICTVCPTTRAMKSGQLEVDEVPITRADGSEGTLELFAFPMFDEQGLISGVVEYVRDVTEQKQAEALRKEREELYRSLFENNSTVMLLIDPADGSLVDANPSAAVFYGHSRSKLRKMKVTDLNDLSPEEVQEKMRQAQEGPPGSFNFRHRLDDGTTREVEVFSGPITVQGRPLLCSIVHDISERRTAEREMEKLIEELQQALSEVKTLRGFIPICSSCKKIRDDSGYWNQIEIYISQRSEAEFSHSMCPDCIKEYYPGLKLE